MITMVDEIFDRADQDGRADLHRGVDRLFGAIARELGQGMKVFHDIQWSAPWAPRHAASKDAGCA
jgi:hypothetical protein